MRYKALAVPTLGGIVAVAAFASSLMPITAVASILPAASLSAPMVIPSEVSDLTSPAVHLVHDAKKGVFGFVFGAAEDVHELAGSTVNRTVSYAGSTAKEVKGVATDNVSDGKHLADKTVDKATDAAAKTVHKAKGAAGDAVGDVKEVSAKTVDKAKDAVGDVKEVAVDKAKDAVGDVKEVAGTAIPTATKTIAFAQGIAGGVVSKVDGIADQTGASAGACPGTVQVTLPFGGAAITACAAVSAGH